MLAITGFSQEPNANQPLTGKDYLKKHKTQKTAAIIMVAAGGIMIVSLKFNF